jgi:AraC-like DNA-binding protein
MDITGLLGILAGIAVAICLFFAKYLFSNKKGNRLNSILLGLLLIAVALRVGKSIWFFIFFGAAPFGLGIGFLGLASIGPLLFLYIDNNQHDRHSVKRSELLHFVFPVLGTFTCWLNTMQVATYLYQLATIVLSIYLLLSWRNYFTNPSQSPDLKLWNRNVIITVTIIWIAFVYQHLTGSLLDYAIGAGIAALPIYYLFVKATRTLLVFSNKQQDLQLSESLITSVKHFFEEKEIFTQHHLTLNQFAKTSDLPAYLITKAVQQLYNRSFPETVNYFRVKKAQQLLLAPKTAQQKITTLSFDVGFRSTSSFYAAFKKETAMTPKQFQKFAAKKRANH